MTGKRERRCHPLDDGPVIVMAEADGYVMVRRPGRMPFVVSRRKFDQWPIWQPKEPSA